MQLYTKILIGLTAGTAVGITANAAKIEGLQNVLVELEPVGTAFIRLITMIVIPLVIASLIVGAASLGDLRKLGRIGGKTVVYYFLTTALAVTVGLLLANIVQPGGGVDAGTRDQLAAQYEGQAQGQLEIAAQAPSLKDVLLNMIPRNPVQAAADFELLPLIFFSVIFGAAISILPENQRKVVLTTLLKKRKDIQREMSRHVILKYTPVLEFQLDTTLDDADRIHKILDDLNIDADRDLQP